MKKIFSGILILLLIVTAGYCQELKSPLQLTITADKQVYELGEEIWIEGFITNNFEKTQDIDPLRPGDATQSFSIHLTDGKRQAKIFPWVGAEARKLEQAWLINQHKIIMPHETIKAFSLKLNDFSVLYPPKKGSTSTSHLLLEYMQIGTYSINWEFGDLNWGVWGSSNPIIINVAGKAEAAGQKH